MCNGRSEPIVLITGFSPFQGVPVNASWEGVKLMNKQEIDRKHNINLVQMEIPVIYDKVDESVPQLWSSLRPKLTIHVGVSEIASGFCLEKQAYRDGYVIEDTCYKCPANYACLVEGAFKIQAELDVERICCEFNEGKCPDSRMITEMSDNAGRYLCEYIYYTSLCIDNTRTLFVHVPLMEVYSSQETARGLERILDLCLRQIDEREETQCLKS